MSVEYLYDGSALGDVVRLKGIDGLTSRAHALDMGSGGVEIDDVAGVLDIVGLKDFAFNETACTAAPRQWTGFTWLRNISQADLFEAPGVARVWDVELNDEQAILQFEAIGQDGKRPAETDFERMTWLLAGPLAGLVADNGLVNLTDNERNLDEADFRDKFPNDVLADMAPQCGKDAWCYWDQAAEEISLFYDVPTAAVYTSTLRLSNDVADADSVTSYAHVGMSVGRSPEDVYSDLIYKFVGGKIWRQRPATAVEFRRRYLVMESTRVGRLATAEAQAAAILLDHSHEDDTVTCTVTISKEEVGLIQKGHRIQVKFTHLPGYEDFVWTRIRGRTLRQTDSKNWYELDLEMATYVAPPAGGGDTGGFPQQPQCDVPGATIIQDSYADAVNRLDIATTAWGGVWPGTPTPGNLLYAAWYLRDHTTIGAYTMPGWDLRGTQGVVGSGGSSVAIGVWTKIAEAGESTTPYITGGTILATPIRVALQEWNGVDEFDSVATGVVENTLSGGAGVAHTPTAGIDVVMIGAVATHAAELGTPFAGTTEDDQAAIGLVGSTGVAFTGHAIIENASGAHTIGSTRGSGVKWAAVSVAFTCSGADDPPQPGQEVPWTVVAMTPSGGVSVGTAPFPYAASSLKVKVDGVLISPASYVETDPTTGDFALSWLLDDDEVVQVSFQGI